MHNADQYDLLIVGGGIIGLFSAYHIKYLHPEKKILLVTEKKVGYGNTENCVALSSPICESRQIYKMYLESLLLFERYSMLVGYKIYKSPIYSITSSTYSMGFDPLFTRLKDSDKTDFIRKYSDFVKIHKDDHIFFNGIAHHFNVHELISKIKDSYIQLGGVIAEATPAKGIVYTDNKAHINLIDGNIISDKVILCMGSYLPSNNIIDGLRISSKNKKIVAFQSDFIPDIPNLPVFNFPDERSFLLARGNHFYLSLTSNEWGSGKETAWKYTAEDDSILDAILHKRINIERGILKGVWGGDNYTEDKIPRIRHYNEQILYVEGASGRGLKLGPYIAAEFERKMFN
ncbi:Glycine/D-amino acid oxidase [Chitinophaga sp. CF118]|uniref:FAD-dependent oxidoreductase n=1 Tax=Chitinophaga sp. CF118 TaxID=1884367 RepID=UPI0008EE855E|nr:FAD-binding oxidoreductase [Chitinophaga sp. CF118]SFD00938.1 Glycine/D-amino acid oxidase [Chitinophaga sp. CF118]